MNNEIAAIECNKCSSIIPVSLSFLGSKAICCPSCGHHILIEQHGGHCWKYYSDDYDISDPCSGNLNVSEDYPGVYVYFCDNHGHFDDG